MSLWASLGISMSQSRQPRRKHAVARLSSVRLLLLFAVALCLTLWLASGNVTAEMLFQSPQSPPPGEQPPAEQPTATQPPAEQPPAEQPPAEPPPAEQPPAEPPPAEQPTATQPPVPQPTSQAPGPVEPLAPVQPIDEAYPRPQDEADTSDLVLDEAELIDTVIVSGAYIWLCCGVVFLLLIPLFLLVLYIRGRSKIIQEEDY